MSPYENDLHAHYANIWKTRPTVYYPEGLIKAQRPDFHVLEFAPEEYGWSTYVYATSGLSTGGPAGCELHLLSARQDPGLVELLADVAHATYAGPAFRMGDVHNFSRPWQDRSICTYGLIAQPEFIPPFMYQVPHHGTSLFMLLPITEKERAFAVRFGLDALMQRFDQAQLNPTDPNRTSVITRV